MQVLSRRAISFFVCWLLGLLVMALLVAACGPATPTEEPMAVAPSATWTLTPFPTATASPLPTLTPAPTEAAATLVAPSEPLTVELKATVIAGLPPTPTPEAPGGESLWGDVTVMPLDAGDGRQPLWAAFTVGMGFYDWDHGHTVAIYAHDDEGWQLLSQTTLTNCADYVNADSLRQVQIEPSRTWLELESYTGAHSGCYDLLSFDGEALRHEVTHFNSSPGAGQVTDLDGDGQSEVILNWTENYVFCYACGVRLPMFDVLRWDGEQLASVELSPLPASADADLKALNDRAVELAQGELWQEAQATIAQALDLDIQPPNSLETVTWNSRLIDLHAEARAEQAQSGAYPLLDNVFYGDYAAAVDVMRPYSMEEIWGPESPLVQGTAAEGWETALTNWITGTTELALGAQPDLAPAYFLQGWAIHLTDPDNPEVRFLVEYASELDPNEDLFAQSVAHLGGPMSAYLPEPPSSYQPPPDLCLELGQEMMQTLQITVTIQDAPFTDYVRDVSGVGCRLDAEGTGLDFADAWTVAGDLRGLLARQGWEEDIRYQADGPTGTASGLWRDGTLCLVSAGWEPSDDAQCPSDRPIGECELEPEQMLYAIALQCAQEVFDAEPEPEVSPTPLPTSTSQPAAEEQWEVRTLLAGPGEPGRLYALLAEISSGAWPAERARLLVSDDYGASWSPFSGGLPAGAGCVHNVNLDYAPASGGETDALYASTCQGLYRWTGDEWALVSPQETGMVAIVYGQPQTIWATGAFASLAPVLRSDDGGATWTPKSDGLIHFNGVANVGIDPRDANTLYAVIWPKYAGSYLRRGTSAGQWQTMPTPLDRSQIDTGITIDGATGALYATAFVGEDWQLWRTLNPSTPNMDDIHWEFVADFGPDVSWAALLASGWGPDGLALYANLSPWVNKTTGEVGPSVPHRSLDGGQTWEPLPIP